MEAWAAYTELLRDLLSTPEYSRFMSRNLYRGFVTELSDFLQQPETPANTFDTAAKLLAKFMHEYPDTLDYSEKDEASDWLPNMLQSMMGYCKVFFAKEVKPGTAGESDRVMLAALNALLRSQAMNATELVKQLVPVMSRYWKNQWSTKKKALKEELVQSVRIFIRCGYIHDHAQELAQLMEKFDLPTLRQGADAGSSRARGQDTIARYDRVKFAFCDFAADIFRCMCSQYDGVPIDAAPKPHGRDEAGAPKKRPRLEPDRDDDEVFHKCPPVVKFAEPSPDSQVWFQIMFAMLSKYPAIIEAESGLALLQTMCGALNRMQEFAEAQPWIILNLRRLLFIEDQMLDSGEASLAAASQGHSDSQQSDNSQRSWERKSEQRANRASKRKELWQIVWASCISAVKSCADAGLMRELLMLLEAIMLTDRVSSVAVQEADDLFSWDAHVIRHPAVARAAWRFLFVRNAKYPPDERKSLDTLAWVCSNLKQTSEHLHESCSMASTFLALLGALTQSNVVCAELVAGMSMPTLSGEVDFRDDDKLAEQSLQLLNEHSTLFDKNLAVCSLLEDLQDHSMDRYFLDKLSLANLVDNAMPQALSELGAKLESEAAKHTKLATAADEARGVKNLCTVCILQLALRGGASKTDTRMAENLLEIRRKFERMFESKRRSEERGQLEALRSLHNLLSLFQQLHVMGAPSGEPLRDRGSRGRAAGGEAVLREPVKLLSQSFMRFSEECLKHNHPAGGASPMQVDDIADEWEESSSRRTEVSHTIMFNLSRVLMGLAALLCKEDDLHGQEEICHSLVNIVMEEMTQRGTLHCLTALDVNFPRYHVVVKLVIAAIHEVDKKHAHANWADIVMRACQFLYSSCPRYIQRLDNEEMQAVLRLFRVLGKNKQAADEQRSYSVRSLSRAGRRAFGDCFKSLLVHCSCDKFTILEPVHATPCGVGDTMLLLLKDADFGVRSHMADVITVMCSGFLEDRDVCEAIEEFVPTHEDEVESRYTTVLTLGKLAIAAEPLERDLLFVLLNLVVGKTDTDEIFLLVKNVVAEVARERGHASATDLTRWHMHAWLRTWTNPAASGENHRRFACLAGANQRIQSFPFRVCGIDSVEDFFQMHRDIILLECCLAEDAEAYRNVLEAVNRSAGAESVVAGKEIRDLYPQLYAHYALRGANDRSQSTAALDAFLESNFARQGGFDIQQLQKKQTEKVLISMFSSVRPVSRATAEGDDRLSICDYTLKHPALAKVCAVRGPSEFPADKLGTVLSQSAMKPFLKQLCDRGSGAEIVAKIHEELCGGLNRLATKVNLLCALLLCVQLLDKKSTEPYVHRYTVHICLVHLKSPELRELCKAILIKACKLDLKDNGGLNTCLHLRDVVSELASSTPAGDTNDSEYIDLLIKAASKGLRNVHEALESVTPLPAKLRVSAETHKAIEKLKRSCATNGLQAELVRFVAEDIADPSSQLSHLQHILHSAGLESGRFPVDGDSSRVISQCIWKLINMCGSGKPGSTGAGGVEQLASACLGELGPVCSHLISFSSHRVHEDDADKTDELARNVKILLMLDGYQIESSKNVVKTARHTLRAVLGEEKGKQAFARLRETDDSRNKFMDVHYRARAQPFPDCEWVSLDNADIWTTHDKSYSEWVCGLCSACIAYGCDDPVLTKCFELSKFKEDFAEFILPYAIYDAVKGGGRDGMAMDVFSKYIQKCLADQDTSRQRSIRLLLRVLDLLRQMRVREVLAAWKSGRKQGGKREATKGNTVYFLNIDYLTAAKAALACDAYFTALLYVEQHSEQQNGQVVPLEAAGMPALRLHHDAPPESEVLLQKIYTSINEPDGFYGVNNSLHVRHRIQSFEHERSWDKALGAYDSLLQPHHPHMPAGGSPAMNRSAVDADIRTGLLSSLQKMGYMHMLETYCRGTVGTITPAESVALQEFQYEAAWRSCKWDEQLGHQLLERGMSVGFHASIFKCVQALKTGNHEMFCKTLETGRLSAIQELRATSLESTKNVYSTLSKLQLYVVAEEALSVSKEASRSQQTQKVQQWCKNVASRVDTVREHFSFVEPIIALQVSVLDALDYKEYVPDCLVDLACCARKAQRFPVAAAALQQVFSNEQGRNDAGLLEEARGLWSQGDDDKAVGLARYLIERHKSTADSASTQADKALLSDALRLAGKWMSNTRSESSDVITEQFLKPAVATAERLQDDVRSLKAKYVMATYCEALFRSLQQTEDHRAEALATQEEEVTKWESASSDKENRGILMTLKKQLEQDKKEYEKLHGDMHKLVVDAMKSYVSCLNHLQPTTEKYDIRVVFKLVSLWFESHQQFGRVNGIVGDALGKDRAFPIDKFIPLAYQIVSRLGPKESGSRGKFQTVLRQLIFRMAEVHPHHCLYQIFALQNGERVASSIRNSKGFVAQDQGKTEAAKTMVDQLRSDGGHAELIGQMTALLEAYLELSENPPSGEKGGSVTVKLHRMKEMPLVPATTVDIAIEPTGDYKRWVQDNHVCGFEHKLQFVGGINRPMRICCKGPLGQEFNQLLKAMNDKGGDDLRQDAVMEQVFGVANTLLRNNIETRRRALSIRTYKVIPMTPCVGMIEWCDNTIPIGHYLLGSSGAHKRYRPADIDDKECREKMRSVQDSKKSQSEAMKEYRRITKRFRPVFHHFFLEHFPQPAHWFERRLAYTRSVAAASIVGYIVGLGDRHSHNILVDKATADVIHIDLGVAFEQGKLLKTPENVPFRLTRDIVSGMGVTGCEGAFLRCAEETLGVLRDNKESLLTVLEVFFHDPLYRWTISPNKAAKLQHRATHDGHGAAGGGNKKRERGGGVQADRVLARLRQKLDGFESGHLLSVKGQVKVLVNGATSPPSPSRAPSSR